MRNPFVVVASADLLRHVYAQIKRDTVYFPGSVERRVIPQRSAQFTSKVYCFRITLTENYVYSRISLRVNGKTLKTAY